MAAKRETSYSKKTDLRLISAILLVFLIAFSTMSSFSMLVEIEAEKIEKLAEGENDIDLEEKEKNLEIEEDTYLNSYIDRYFENNEKLQASQYLGQLPIYHLKIPTPPPDVA